MGIRLNILARLRERSPTLQAMSRGEGTFHSSKKNGGEVSVLTFNLLAFSEELYCVRLKVQP
jgi:hypothetical protein